MTDWTVYLEFAEGSSSKFWRARVEGKTLYVNYGKIGSNGQTQVKDLSDPAAAKVEYDKLVRDKRKKGYHDAGAGDPETAAAGDADDEDADGERPAAPAPATKRTAGTKPAAAAVTPPASPSVPGHRMALDAGSRKALATLYLDGNTVRMHASETYASSEAAAEAFERLKKLLGGEGYKSG
jgi:predicted DNA-binding WGR domain protein